MIGTIGRVIRGEGLASAARRAYERIGEAVTHAGLIARGTFVETESAPILNVSFAPVAPRLGGVQQQLIARLREERALRNVALFHPRGLDVSRPLPHGRIADSIERALEITGARAIHVEGTDGAPLDVLLRFAESGIRVLVSVHDFSLWAGPHLIAFPGEPARDYTSRRAQARELLAKATFIFSSRFLLDQHRELFALPQLHGAIIELGAIGTRHERTGNAIAFAGAVKWHKGGALLPEVFRDVDAHVFGGGDEALLRSLRAMPNVHVHGYYRQGKLPSLLARHDIGLVVLPSIWPETFSIVLSEAWLAGAAVVAFDLGAPAERIRAHGGGWLVPFERGTAGFAEIIEEWRAGRRTTAIPTSIATPRDAARAHVEWYRNLGITLARAPEQAR